MQSKNFNPDDDLAYGAMHDIFRPRPRLTGSEWADRYRVVSPATSPEPGKWRTSRVPYIREPLDMATDHLVEKVVIMAASQVAKSELLINTLGYFIDQEPSAIMMVQPTVETAEAFSKERIAPTLKCTPALAARMQIDPEKGSSRKSESTIRMKNFLGGYLAMVGSNSPSGLASRPIRVLLCDEIDRFGITQEGDPLTLAEQRTRNFSNRKIVFVSTPTTEERGDGPTIYSEFMKSDQRAFMVRCPHCGERFELIWGNVKWEKDSQGEPIEDSIRMECPHCNAKVRGNGKPDPYLLESGVWVPQNPSGSCVGYHLTALCSPWVELRNLVQAFVQANRNKDKKGLMEFVNLQLGEPWHEDEAEYDMWEKLSERREWYGADELPDGILLLTCGVDVQRDRLEATVYGWGAGWESWGVCHRIIYGDPAQQQVWNDLNILLMSSFTTKSKRELKIMCTFVDSGDGETTDQVYAYTKPRERCRIYAIKGSGTPGRNIVENPTKNNRYKAHLFVLGVDAAKRSIKNHLSIQDVGPGFAHYPRDPDAGFNSEFFQQLTSEVHERRFEKGRLIERWKKIRERNEALDCRVYAFAAAKLLNPNFEILKAASSAGEEQKSNSARPARSRGLRVISRGIEL